MDHGEEHDRASRPCRFFGLHFDLHAGPNDRELGAQVTEELVERIIREARPDYIQYDCKGHGGWLAYPNGIVLDGRLVFVYDHNKTAPTPIDQV